MTWNTGEGCGRCIFACVIRGREVDVVVAKILYMYMRYNCHLISPPLLHCTENPIYVFPEKELRSLSPNSYIHAIYVFPGLVHIFGCSKIDRPILEIYRSLTDI
jgi:hypothetical protein